jgi:hypothetical protein
MMEFRNGWKNKGEERVNEADCIIFLSLNVDSFD